MGRLVAACQPQPVPKAGCRSGPRRVGRLPADPPPDLQRTRAGGCRVGRAHGLALRADRGRRARSGARWEVATRRGLACRGVPRVRRLSRADEATASLDLLGSRGGQEARAGDPRVARLPVDSSTRTAPAGISSTRDSDSRSPACVEAAWPGSLRSRRRLSIARPAKHGLNEATGGPAVVPAINRLVASGRSWHSVTCAITQSSTTLWHSAGRSRSASQKERR